MDAASPITDWALDRDVVHLNHGSYGGCPRVVMDAATAWRVRLEAAPMRFLVLEWQGELDRARAALAAFVGAPAEQLVFVPNATTAIAIALGSARLDAGDELITTDHAYRACRNQLARIADARGAHVVTVTIPLPYDPDALVDAIAAAVTSRTRLALLDHVTSPTALRLPLERIVPALAARGVDVLVDGAHAPGQLELDVGALGATWYAGNNHKWLCAPKGTGFLATTTPTRPVVTSHGASPEYGPANRLHAELDWAGTHDPAAHLAVTTAIEWLGSRGWPSVIARNHALAIELRARIVEGLGGAPHLAPDATLGAMAAIPITLPAGKTALELQRRLLVDGWELAIVDFASGPLLRISAHLYTSSAQAEPLVVKLRALGVTLRGIT